MTKEFLSNLPRKKLCDTLLCSCSLGQLSTNTFVITFTSRTDVKQALFRVADEFKFC